MPLSLFVPSVLSASSGAPLSPHPASPHPLHDLLEPLMMAPRSASNKYYVDLPRILADGGGAGEVEEDIMWFALSFEKENDDDQSSNNNNGDEAWKNERWRKDWLERMERRE
jgi:hypothetical protein